MHPAGIGAAGRDAAAHVLVDDVAEPVLPPADVRHLGAVLRLDPEAPVTVTDGRGAWRSCRFGGGGLQPAGDVGFVERPAPALTVAFAPVKGDRPEWAVQKLTELGVDRIVLLRTGRSVVRWEPGPRLDRQLARLREVARQALMQSRGLWLPSVLGVEPFAAVAAWPGAALSVPGAAGGPSLDRPTVLIGPEGGWTPEELEVASSLPRVGLGPSVLRSETAAVAAGVLLCALRAGVV